jgi:hypothetical protein
MRAGPPVNAEAKTLTALARGRADRGAVGNPLPSI